MSRPSAELPSSFVVHTRKMFWRYTTEEGVGNSTEQGDYSVSTSSKEKRDIELDHLRHHHHH